MLTPQHRSRLEAAYQRSGPPVLDAFEMGARWPWKAGGVVFLGSERVSRADKGSDGDTCPYGILDQGVWSCDQRGYVSLGGSWTCMIAPSPRETLRQAVERFRAGMEEALHGYAIRKLEGEQQAMMDAARRDAALRRTATNRLRGKHPDVRSLLTELGISASKLAAVKPFERLVKEQVSPGESLLGLACFSDLVTAGHLDFSRKNTRTLVLVTDRRLVLANGSRRFDMSLQGLGWSEDDTISFIVVWSVDGEVTLFGDASQQADLRVGLLAASTGPRRG